MHVHVAIQNVTFSKTTKKASREVIRSLSMIMNCHFGTCKSLFVHGWFMQPQFEQVFLQFIILLNDHVPLVGTTCPSIDLDSVADD